MLGIIKIHDKSFLNLISDKAELKKLYSGMLWAEGPVYFTHGQYLLWSDIPANKIYQWIGGLGVKIYKEQSNFANGNTKDHQGRLITCEHLTRRVVRTEHDGSITILADQYNGKRLNSPNDIVVKSDDSIWFTDPTYGILSDYEGKKSDQEQETCFVFKLDPNSMKLEVVADDFDKPNGIAFSSDEKILYVSDTGKSHNINGPKHIRQFSVTNDNKLYDAKVFVEIKNGLSDGFRLDQFDNIWTSAGTSVQCFTPDAQLIGEIEIGETVSNLEFGGLNKDQLFITASSSLYCIALKTSGQTRI